MSQRHWQPLCFLFGELGAPRSLAPYLGSGLFALYSTPDSEGVAGSGISSISQLLCARRPPHWSLQRELVSSPLSSGLDSRGIGWRRNFDDLGLQRRKSPLRRGFRYQDGPPRCSVRESGPSELAGMIGFQSFTNCSEIAVANDQDLAARPQPGKGLTDGLVSRPIGNGGRSMMISGLICVVQKLAFAN